MSDEISASHMTTDLQSQPLREFCVAAAEAGHLCVGRLCQVKSNHSFGSPPLQR